MSLSIKRLAGETLVYGASTMVGRLLNWLLMPFYIRVILPEEYGVIVNIYGVISVLLVLFTYGLETGFFRYAREGKEDAVYSSSLKMLGISSTLLFILTVVFSKPFSLFFYDGAHQSAIVLTGIIVASDAFLSLPFARLRLKNLSLRFGWIKLSGIFLNIILNFFFLLLLPFLFSIGLFSSLSTIYEQVSGVFWILLSNAFSSVFQFAFFFSDWKFLKGAFELPLIKRMLRYSWPVLLVGLTGMLTQNVDKIWMPKLVKGNGFLELAVYGANFKIGVLMSLFTQSFRFAFEPYFFKNREKGRSAYALVMEYFIFFGLLIFISVLLFQDFVNILLTPEYLRGNVVIPLILLALFFYGIYFNLSLWYKLSDKTIYGAYFGLLGMALTVALNFVLVPRIGFMGAAVALAVGYGSMMLVSYYYGQRFYPIAYPLGRIFLHFLVAGTVVLADSLLSIPSYYLDLAFKAVLILSFLFYIRYIHLKFLPSNAYH
ncbi:lipopolysaccharide biosynthesis protein [Geofilum rhodophaeum]|uniref:lipopolysaccharide biosynthesis protein n=1 Tax=Geofilum rhodophaeum TaxID=1965019 RepID=UPI000B5211AE|nr:oligosaccharide flippase family protein [Geofilum rhodophaeum]